MGSDKSLCLFGTQAYVCTIDGLLLDVPLGTLFNNIGVKVLFYFFKKNSRKCRLLYFDHVIGLTVIIYCTGIQWKSEGDMTPSLFSRWTAVEYYFHNQQIQSPRSCGNTVKYSSDSKNVTSVSVKEQFWSNCHMSNYAMKLYVVEMVFFKRHMYATPGQDMSRSTTVFEMKWCITDISINTTWTGRWVRDKTSILKIWLVHISLEPWWYQLWHISLISFDVIHMCGPRRIMLSEEPVTRWLYKI